MRLPDWNQRLAETIEAARPKTFAYGEFDCALFAADCIIATTGIDRAESVRGYDSKAGAEEIISRYGSIDAMLTALIEVNPTHPAFAQRGDIVTARFDGEEDNILAIGVCDGYISWFPGREGIVHRPTLSAIQCWKID